MFLDVPVEVRVGSLEIAKPLILWINDGLMAVFVFMVGLELKREIMDGALSNTASILLPVVGAIGGIIVPVTIYVAINNGALLAMTGWTIPVSTVIAFALGILVLFGSRVPLTLKVFLVSVAIFDDIAVIVIIAVFYTNDISNTALSIAVCCLLTLGVLNKRGVADTSTYFLVGMMMWVALLKSGVHATLAGVALVAFILMRLPSEPQRYPLKDLERYLHRVVAFVILPIFAF